MRNKRTQKRYYTTLSPEQQRKLDRQRHDGSGDAKEQTANRNRQTDNSRSSLEL